MAASPDAGYRTHRLLIALACVCVVPAVLPADVRTRHDIVPLALMQRESKAAEKNDNYVPGPGSPEALVEIWVTVDAKGQVVGAEVAGGFFTPEQGEVARDMVTRLVFRPRSVDGNPVESSGMVPIRFTLPGAPPSGVTQSLARVEQLLEERRWSDALEKLSDMLANEAVTVTDYLSIEAHRVVAYEGLGEPEKVVDHSSKLRSCATPSPRNIPAALCVQTLLRAMRAHRQLRHFGDALELYDAAEQLVGEELMQPFAREAESLRAMVSGGDAITVPMTLDENGAAGFKLFRRTMSLGEVTDGKLTTAIVECLVPGSRARRWLGYDLVPLAEPVSVAAQVHDCTAHLRGSPGARVLLVQSGLPIAEN